MRTTSRAAALAVLVGLAGAACTTTRAATPVERPALEVPPPPPRVVAPLPRPQPNQLEPVENLGPGPFTAPSKPRRETPPQQVEPKPEEPKPVEPPPVAPPVQQPAPPQLRLPENSGSAQASQIMQLIVRTKDILRSLKPENLPRAAQSAFKEATLFATQAEEHLKTNNLPLAKEFADKAERRALGLQGR